LRKEDVRMNARQRVDALRRLMRRQRLSAYLVPSSDPHLSEYVPECWKRRHWLTGFHGSVGDAVVTQREACLWVDSRYFLEAERDLDPRVFRLFKKGLPGTPTLEAYLNRALRRGQALGVDPQLLSRTAADSLEQALAPRRIRLRFPKKNLVDAIWAGRPPLPPDPVRVFPDRYAGESVRSKLSRLRAGLARRAADAHVVLALDAVAWLFNIRGTDVRFNPYVIAAAIVTRKGAQLFVERRKVTPALREALEGRVELRPYRQLGRELKALARAGASVLVDPDATTRAVLDDLRGARLVFMPSPITGAKAIKNRVEIAGMRAAHVLDGVAHVRFLHWMEGALRRGRLRESDLAARIDAFRMQERGCQGPSFETIVGFGANGAIIHYRPEPGRDARVGRRGVLLIDSGGQYLMGTTDVTRTLTIGRPTQRERELFTAVLRGHINLARTRFPKGTKGSELEALARQPVWDVGQHYLHGTGHGVGHYLGVHEGPIGFSERGTVPLMPGNTLSLEPGCYEAGKYGFRTENLVLVAPDRERSRKGREWLRLEALTLCPIDRRLIDVKRLGAGERAWVDAYHREVYRLIAPRLRPAVRRWLKKATAPLR
jgi:Xaa-Pro aminopeptidase